MIASFGFRSHNNVWPLSCGIHAAVAIVLDDFGIVDVAIVLGFVRTVWATTAVIVAAENVDTELAGVARTTRI